MSPARLVVPVLLLSIADSCASRPAARDVAVPYAGQTPPGLTPELFAPGLISTEGSQGHAIVYPGGREIYFQHVERRGGRVVSTIRVTRLVNGSWTSPEPASFSLGTLLDGYPAVHPDGSRMYFQSNRPIDSSESRFEFNIWYVERRGEGWSEARPIGRPINGRLHSGGPSVTADGTMYFCLLNMDSGRHQILRSRFLNGAYQEPDRLPEAVNSLHQACDSYVAPDESYIVFPAFPRTGHANNPGGLYVSIRDSSGSWSPARDIRAAIGAEVGTGATISPDGRFLFFVREDPAGRTGLDVWWVSTEVVRSAARGTAR